MLRGIHKRLVAAAAIVTVAAVTTGCDKVPLFAPTASTISLTAPTRSLPTGGTTEVTATVLESAGTPVQNGTTVHFTTTLGSLAPVEAQTRNGIATATFNAGDVKKRDNSCTTKYHPNAQRHAVRSMPTCLSAINATASPPTCASVEDKNTPHASTT